VWVGAIAGLSFLGFGSAFPALELDNEAVLRRLASKLWPHRAPDDDQLRFMAASMRETLGVDRRAWAHEVGKQLNHKEEATTIDLAVSAGARALEDAKLLPRDVKLVLCATSTPPRMTSTVSAMVGHRLGAVGAACLDVRSGCSGGLHALATAGALLQAGQGPALVIGTETFSKVIPPSHKMAALSLGDGAGALVLGRGKGRLMGIALETDGSYGHLVTAEGALPPTHDEIDQSRYELSGDPVELTKLVPSRYVSAIGRALGSVHPDEVSLFVPHQTSVPLISEVVKRSGLALERTVINVGAHGNIGAAGWLVALAEAAKEGKVLDGTRLLIAAAGGGLSWGAALIEVSRS
jgi:3-oxoacyl-[acyl-carrier-protein] synthase-3